MAVEPILDQGGGAGQVLFAKDGLAVELGVIQNTGLIGDHRVAGAGGGAGRAHPPVRDEQLGDLLVHRQGLDIGGGAVGGVQTPVVDGCQLAGAVDILKGEAVLLDDPAGHRADGRAVGIVVICKVVGCFFCHEAFLLLGVWAGRTQPAAGDISLFLLWHKRSPKGKDYFWGNPYNFFILPDFTGFWAKKSYTSEQIRAFEV